MCEPTTIAAIGVTAVSTGVGIYSQRQRSKFENQAAENNRQLLAIRRSDVLARGAEAAGEAKAAGARAAAEATAQVAASGVSTTVGSPAAAIAASHANAAADAETIKANAARQAWGFDVEEQNIATQSDINKRASILGQVGTGLSGASKAVSLLGKV